MIKGGPKCTFYGSELSSLYIFFFSKQKQVKLQRKCIVKESCNSCSLQGLGANMAEAESSTDQRMLRGGGGDV